MRHERAAPSLEPGTSLFDSLLDPLTHSEHSHLRGKVIVQGEGRESDEVELA